mmetsp:Transcript_13453/g.15437  ORF Transcript_13453/g.15437 Transcript_13453/m.15437 type:complete len:111 (+) Transcript_13453:664-996(+)
MVGSDAKYLADTAPSKHDGMDVTIYCSEIFQSTNSRRANPESPDAKPKHSVKSADAIAEAALGRVYSGPSNGNTNKNTGENNAAPPMPASWQHVATSVAIGSMKAYFKLE